MRIEKSFRSDQEVILRFLDALGGGAAILSGSKKARPGFFIFAHTFIQEYIEAGFFKDPFDAKFGNTIASPTLA